MDRSHSAVVMGSVHSVTARVKLDLDLCEYSSVDVEQNF